MYYIEKEDRPWGTFFVLENEINFKVKRIEVLPGKRLSYQYHSKREENWIITEGVASVIVDDFKFTLTKGESIFIPKMAKHRIQNDTNQKLTIIEVQTGEYFGEDDIVRLEDDFNRI